MNGFTQSAKFDVVIVGYGPTGLVLASLLGQRGHTVAVVERWPTLFGKPRLTHIDGETARLISLAGDADQAFREAWDTPRYYWVNGKGQVLLEVVEENTRRMIWDDHLSVHQPHFEEAIHDRVTSLSNVKLFRGYVATELKQDGDGAYLTCVPHDKDSQDATAGPVRLQGRYLVGADGAKSFVRTSLGVERIDFGFNKRWLLVDTDPLKPLPAKFNKNGVQICDPRRGHMHIPIGKSGQRFNFALLPNESTEEMQTEEAAYGFLKRYHGLGREDVSLIRNTIHTFECRLAKTWRVGRVFLAGDAAHTNPPYLGQGACSAMRDGANLAWKFDLVLRGLADEALLDTYEVERRPHAQKLMLASRKMGVAANLSNRFLAAIRDVVLRLKLAPRPEFPILTDGVLARDASGKPVREAGTLPPQGRLSVDGRSARFDDHVGFHFALIARHGCTRGIPASQQEELDRVGIRIVELAPQGQVAAANSAIDVDGVYGRLLQELGADVAIIRPDFVLYGYSDSAGLSGLLEGLLNQLRFKRGKKGSPQSVAA